jgi:hypothetical protein
LDRRSCLRSAFWVDSVCKVVHRAGAEQCVPSLAELGSGGPGGDRGFTENAERDGLGKLEVDVVELR